MENNNSPKFSENTFRAFVALHGRRAIAMALHEDRAFGLALAAWMRKRHNAKAW